MTKGRLEAFSDCVISILITIMVLGLQVPHGTSLEALRPAIPSLLIYLLSFLYLAIYWSNHHHLLHTVERVNGAILWANLHLLFWLSLVPFVTAWMWENHFGSLPTAVYGAILLFASVAYFILEKTIIIKQGPNSKLARAVGNETKGKISVLLYFSAIPLAFVHPWMSHGLYILVALMWLVPDRRIEARFNDARSE